MCRAARSRAPRPASATARCCASRSRTRAKARSIAAASSRSSITPARGCSASSGNSRRRRAAVPVDKKQAGRELNIAPRTPAAPRTATLSASISCARAAMAWPRQGQGAAWIARDREGGQPDRDPRPRNSAGLFAIACATPRPRSLRRLPAARTGATCRSSPSIRPTPRITTTRFTPNRSDPNNKAGYIVKVAIADVTSMCGRARRWTATR